MERQEAYTVPSTPLVAPRSWHWALDGHPPGPNQLRGHWAVRSRLTKPWKDHMALLCRTERPRWPLARARVTVTLCYPRRPWMDPDNCIASLKGTIDGLVTGGLLAGDSDKHLLLDVRQVLGHRKQVLIDVVEVTGG